MRLIRYGSESDGQKLAELFADGSVVALGFFDGVHVAHRALLGTARELAKKEGLPFVVFTFSGDGADIKTPSMRLFSDKDRLSLIEDCGADVAVIASFSSLSGLSPEAFVRDFLTLLLGAKFAVCGYNFRFGRGASAGSDELARLMRDCGGEAVITPVITEGGEPVSSTRIRTLLSERKPDEAAALLGSPYFISGEVTHGRGVGTGLGIPTVNMKLSEGGFNMPRGVYATAVVIDGSLYPAVTNVGDCPTFEVKGEGVETNICGYSGDLYGRNLRVYFLKYLRETKAFGSEKELIMQINIDKNEALRLAGELKWQELGLK